MSPKQPKTKSRNLRDYTYEELIWLHENKCKHGHRYISHLNCWLNAGEIKPERVGFLDIETSNLSPAFGVVLCWCIKDRNSDTIYYDYLKKEDIFSDDEDKRIIETCVDTMKQFDRIVGHYSCLTPGHRALTEDLRWIDIADLKTGDKLLAFEENPIDNPQRKFVRSEVLHNNLILKDCYKIKLSDGTSLTATGEHPFLVKEGIGAGQGHYKWRTVESLYKTLPSKRHNGGINFNRVMDVWDTNNTREAGWIAGFFDGEGSTSQFWTTQCEQPHYSFTISASQNQIINKDLIQQTEKYLQTMNIKYSISEYDKKNHCSCVNILGDKGQKLKFLGSIRPTKLLRQFNVEKLGTLRSSASNNTKIIEIEHIGPKMVCELGTTSKTYFVEGFASHNCRFDIPYLRTRAVMHDRDTALGFPRQGELIHTDTWLIARSKFKFHSNRQNIIAETLFNETIKTRIDHRAWRRALQGNTAAIRESLDHCEKDVVELQENFEAMLPFYKLTRTSI